jgi:hypothetical protein
MIAVLLSPDAISQSGLVAKVALHQFNLATEQHEVATVADDGYSAMRSHRRPSALGRLC